MNKNTPIFKKKVRELIRELELSPVDVLSVIEPLAESLRKKSSQTINKAVNDWGNKRGIRTIRTDY